METPHTIVFIGPQGSGKGTQIERIKARLRELDPAREVVDVQSGKAFRYFAEVEGGFTADSVRATLNTGALQPLFLSVALWGRLLVERVTPSCHLLVDGFPRTKHEAAVLESAFSFYGRTNVSIVYLDAPEEVVRERMHLRARPDDTNESIEERLRWYREETLPVIDYYKSRANTRLVVIDGTKSVDAVYADICAGLGLA